MALLIPGVGIVDAGGPLLVPGAGIVGLSSPVETTVSIGTGEVVIEGGQPTLVLTVAAATRADAYGGGLYDRNLELQAEDELILQVIQAFLKKAA